MKKAVLLILILVGGVAVLTTPIQTAQAEPLSKGMPWLPLLLFEDQPTGGGTGPILTGPATVKSGLSFVLSWTYTWGMFVTNNDGYELQESTTSPTSGFTEIWSSKWQNDHQSPKTFIITSRPAGTYYYRVRAYIGQFSKYSDWSNIHQVNVTPVPTLTYITISGPSQVEEASGAEYACTAYYSDGSNRNVTNSATWSENSAHASISNAGQLITDAVKSNETFTITAEYAGLSDTHSVTITRRPPLARKTFSGSSSGGLEIITPNPAVAYPGLAGFLLDFSSGDHHISNIYAGFHFVTDSSIAIVTDYSDGNADDNYTWMIDRLALPAGTTLYKVTGSSPCGFNQVLMPAGFLGVPVLMGFGVQTIGTGDHHLDKFSVQLFKDQFGQLELGITFQDNGGLCAFDFNYEVAYALVPSQHVFNSGLLTGTDGGGSDMELLNATQPVLQGFELDFASSDHHLDQTGVRLESGLARIYYNDNNDDDDFNWKIWWVDVH